MRDIFPETALVAVMKALTSDGPARHSKDVRLDDVTRVPVEPTYIYGARMYYGTFAILTDLGAEISFRKTAVEAVARYGDADVQAEVAGLRC